jgi:hypothetical protein
MLQAKPQDQRILLKLSGEALAGEISMMERGLQGVVVKRTGTS